jgi:uncharacterized protein involved in outer membrane biogenesis
MLNAISYTIRKLSRLVLIVAIVFLIIACTGLFFAPRFFNTNAFKHHIESILMTKFQRVVRIQDVSISFLPDIYIQLSGMTVSDAAGFEKDHQIQVQSSEIYLKIWPLLEKKIVIKRVVLSNLSLKLTRLANGRNNWSDLFHLERKPKKSTKQAFQSFSLQTDPNITINDANIEINDHQDNRHFQLSHLNYQSTGHLQNIIHLDVDLTATLPIYNDSCKIDTHTELNGRASFLFNQGRFSINDAHLQMNATALFPDDHFVESHLDTKISLSYDHAAVELSDMALNINDILFKGSIYARNLFETPAISGQINISTTNLTQALSFLPHKIGYNGQLNADLLFQTHGNTLESLIKHSIIEIHTNMGSGNIVLPDHVIDKEIIILKQLSQAGLYIHLSPIDNSQKTGFQYGFQTKLDGNIKELDSLLDLEFKTQSRVFFGPDLYNICINDGDFEIQTHWKKLSPAPYFIKGNVYGNLKTQKILVKNVSISGPLINGKLTTEIVKQKNAPALQSHINIEIDQARKVFQAFSLEVPKFYDPTVFQSTAFDGDVLLTKNYMQLSNMKFSIDEAELLGSIIYQYDPSVVNFDIIANHLNLDRHWILRSNPSHSSSNAKDSFSVNGKIQFNNLRIYNVSIDQMHMNYVTQDNIYRLSPIYGQMYGGKFNGHWTFDYKPRVPKTSLLLHSENIQIEKFLKDYNQFDRIIGLLNMKASLSWDLIGGRMDRASINGNAKFDLTKGIINGIQIVPTDVQKQILEIHKKQPLKIPKQQYLNRITGLVRFRNGCMHNSDLMAYAKGLRVKGKGTLDIVKREIDYMFYVGIAHFPVIPYHVKGPIADTKAYLDSSEFLKTAVSDFFNQAGKLGPDTIKDTLALSGRALDMNTESLQNSVDKSSETIKKTIDKSSGTIKETLAVGSDIIQAGKDAFQSLGNRLKGFLFNQHNEDKPSHNK